MGVEPRNGVPDGAEVAGLVAVGRQACFMHHAWQSHGAREQVQQRDRRGRLHFGSLRWETQFLEPPKQHRLNLPGTSGVVEITR